MNTQPLLPSSSSLQSSLAAFHSLSAHIRCQQRHWMPSPAARRKADSANSTVLSFQPERGRRQQLWPHPPPVDHSPPLTRACFHSNTEPAQESHQPLCAPPPSPLLPGPLSHPAKGRDRWGEQEGGACRKEAGTKENVDHTRTEDRVCFGWGEGQTERRIWWHFYCEYLEVYIILYDSHCHKYVLVFC